MTQMTIDKDKYLALVQDYDRTNRIAEKRLKMINNRELENLKLIRIIGKKDLVIENLRGKLIKVGIL